MKKIIGIFIALSAVILISYNVYSMQERIKKFEQTKQKYIELYYNIAKTVYPVAKKVVKTSKLDDNSFHVIHKILTGDRIMLLVSLSHELEHYSFHVNKLEYKIPNNKKTQAKFLYYSCSSLTDLILYGEQYSKTKSEEKLKKVKILSKEYVDFTDKLVKRYNLDEIKTD
ncbi:hypothetical protein CLTEP_26220 [Clostridium tepidiprofundi DSM 19306]|uniref:Uncharacterized protein n=1 Tax=Clostridium tepidiprofundi DSM 19306 TaxID=1121338 RepID=A0A151AS73_9CLOT|nr:hypothetical protein [Clostridium tepidiprofundi]KYH30498.1 hypothetical protein CLTEP_26220 [Clostridium tepidiprofundi DSM 19306]